MYALYGTNLYAKGRYTGHRRSIYSGSIKGVCELTPRPAAATTPPAEAVVGPGIVFMT